MAQVNHNAVEVHLLNHPLAEGTYAVVGIASLGAVANVVVTVVAECDIDNASLGEVFHVGCVVVQCQSVLDGQHHRLATLALINIEVGRCACQAQVVAVAANDVFNAVENEVGIGHWGNVGQRLFVTVHP